jgi:hypothetical protein
MSFFKDLTTGIDGVTHDPARALWVLGIVTFILFTGYEVWHTKHFDMEKFGIAYGVMLAAGASGVKIKESTEPPALK